MASPRELSAMSLATVRGGILKPEGTIAPIGAGFPTTFRSYGPEGAFSYFHVKDGKVFPGIGW